MKVSMLFLFFALVITIANLGLLSLKGVSTFDLFGLGLLFLLISFAAFFFGYEVRRKFFKK